MERRRRQAEVPRALTRGPRARPGPARLLPSSFPKASSAYVPATLSPLYRQDRLRLPDPGSLCRRRRPLAAGYRHRSLGLVLHVAGQQHLEPLQTHHSGAWRTHMRRARLSGRVALAGGSGAACAPAPGRSRATWPYPAHRHPQSLARRAASAHHHIARRRPVRKTCRHRPRSRELQSHALRQSRHAGRQPQAAVRTRLRG